MMKFTDKLEYEEDGHVYTHIETGVVVPSVSQIITPPEEFNKIPEWVKGPAMRRGTAIHAEIEKLLREGHLGVHGCSPQADTFFKALVRLDLYRIVAIEEMVFCEEFFYAGRTDVVVTLRIGKSQQLAVVDIKTGKPYPKHSVQTFMYANPIAQHLKVDPRSIRRFCIYVDKPVEDAIVEHTEFEIDKIAFEHVYQKYLRRGQ